MVEAAQAQLAVDVALVDGVAFGVVVVGEPGLQRGRQRTPGLPGHLLGHQAGVVSDSEVAGELDQLRIRHEQAVGHAQELGVLAQVAIEEGPVEHEDR